jgi:hypothetical protein
MINKLMTGCHNIHEQCTSLTCEVLYAVFEQEALRIPQYMRHGTVHGDVPGQEEENQSEHVHPVCKHNRDINNRRLARTVTTEAGMVASGIRYHHTTPCYCSHNTHWHGLPLSSAVMIAGPTRAKDSSNIEYTLTGMVGARAAFGAAPTSRNM